VLQCAHRYIVRENASRKISVSRGIVLLRSERSDFGMFFVLIYLSFTVAFACTTSWSLSL
jgi:hypothetical protein